MNEYADELSPVLGHVHCVSALQATGKLQRDKGIEDRVSSKI